MGPRGAVWVFAASLGETRAASPLIRALVEAGHHICLTHSSPAGLAEGKRLFVNSSVTHRYVPLDLFWALMLFLGRLRPSVGLVVESELWPAQLQLANWFDIPMVQVNGNLNEHTINRDRRFLGRLRLELLTRFHAILTKSQTHLARYIRAGVDPRRVRIVGELKFDQWVDPAHRACGQKIRQEWSPDRQVFLIASSVQGEEPALHELVAHLLAMPRPPRIIWAPRSPQRFRAVGDALEAAGYLVARRSDVLGSDLSGVIPKTDILIGDSTGEMNVWYQMSDLVFVGASLTDDGGHNISEPLALGRPVMMGSSTYGITFPAVEAEAAGALITVNDAAALIVQVKSYLADPDLLSAFALRARTFASQHVGAAERTLSELSPFLAPTRDQS